MKRFFTLIFLLSFTFQSFGQQRIRVTDFGAKPGSGEDTRHAFQRAVEACGGKNAIIEFPKGRYDFWQEEGRESSTAMHLHDVENITIEGNGSEFVFHGKMRVMLVEKSQGVVLRNFSTDWDRPYISQGEFVAVYVFFFRNSYGDFFVVCICCNGILDLLILCVERHISRFHFEIVGDAI